MHSESVNDPTHPSPASAGWRVSVLTLIASRVELIQLELKQALRDRSRTLAALIAGIMCAFFTWGLIVAAGIAAIADALNCPWHFIALVAAGFHLLATLLFFNTAKAPQPEPFPVTRSEFQKDREWIESLQKTPESKS